MIYEERPWLKFYDPWVEPEFRFEPTTYQALIERTFKEFPHHTALYFMDQPIRFAELDQQAARFAGFLKEVGCGPGQVLGICMPNLPQWLIAYLGAQKAGCISTGISPLLTPGEMLFQLQDAGVHVLVIMDAFYLNTYLKIADMDHPLEHIVVTAPPDCLPSAMRPSQSEAPAPAPGRTVNSWQDVLAKSAPIADLVAVQPEDTLVIQYTGGTTGTPKGALIPNHQFVDNMIRFEKWLDIERGHQVDITAFPLCHGAGLYSHTMFLQQGHAVALLSNPRDTQFICQAIKKYRPYSIGLVPTLYQMLLADPAFRALDFSSVNYCISGAAPMPPETMETLNQLIGPGKIIEIYGLTESGPLITMNPKGRSKTGSVGVPIQGISVKLVDLETGTRELPVGEPGHLIYKTQNMMKGYHHRPDETAAVLRDFQGQRWLFTGDVARMDEDGYFWIVDRAKDMISVGGYKVFSKEIEDLLYKHPAVDYCAIVGVPNPDHPGSELVKAFIQLALAFLDRPQDGIREEILAYCREELSPYKVPKFVEIVEAIPLTPIGKVDKKLLRSG
jgi:acyl-CoA synthetase (AMP-forming)/AMP-acid ligase II